MGEETIDLAADSAVEAVMRDELAREARALKAVVPVLRHLLSSDAHALVSDAVLARVRGMITDLATQLLAAQAGHAPATGSGADPAAVDDLAQTLMTGEALLGFCHALCTEYLITERLQQHHAIDPVLSPLLQELIASEDPGIASLAMSTLAAQSRFVQSQRRMALALGELPAELFHALVAQAKNGADASAGLERLQAEYDEAAGRMGLLARLIAAMRRGVIAALGVDHAGLALFASALDTATRCGRADAVLACHEGQGMHLALLLRVAGLAPDAAERQLALIDPAGQQPPARTQLTKERAAALLAGIASAP